MQSKIREHKRIPKFDAANLEVSKVYIFGCGISGMLLALGLAKERIQTEIIEIKSEHDIANPLDPRTTALSFASKEFLQKNELWDSLSPYCEDIKDIYVCQRMSDHMLHMEAKDQELGIMVTNIDLRREIFKLTKACPKIKIHFDSRYKDIVTSESEIKFILETKNKEELIVADIAIAADGRISEAKKLFFKNRMAKDYKQKAIVFNISHTKNHEGCAIEHFLYRGPFATLPLKGGFTSSIVWSEGSEIADFLAKQDYENLEARMAKFIGGRLGDIKIITKPECYPLSAFITEKYYDGRLVLLADSAHGMHPLAGQGLNMGIKDVECLTRLICKYNDLGLMIDQSLLAKYEKERTQDNINMIRITDTINTVFNSQIKAVNKLTEFGLSVVDRMPLLKQAIINYAKGKRYS